MMLLVEEVSLKIPKAHIDELRWKMRQALEKVKLHKLNITREEGLAVVDTIIILTSDVW